MQTYWIPEERISKVLDFVKKLQRKGIDAVAEETGNIEVRKSDDGRYFRCHEMEVSGIYKIADWQFVASIEHLPEGNIIRNVTDFKVPSRYRTCGPTCEHCGKIRDRKDTYLVYNSKNDEFKQVGRACLKQYTDGLDARTCAIYAEVLETIADAGEDYGDSWLGIEPSGGYDGKRFNRACIKDVLSNGYEKEISKDRIFNLLNSKEDFNTPEIERTEKIVNEYVDMLSNSNYLSDYDSNAIVAWKSDINEARHINIVASFVFTALKRHQKLHASSQEYVGSVGDRIRVEVASARVLYTKAPYTYHGDKSYVYRIVGTDGNIYVWSTTNSDLPEGTIISATIKDHKEYRGDKQTVITRGKIINESAHEQVDSLSEIMQVIDDLY